MLKIGIRPFHLVHRSHTEEQAIDDFRREVGWFKHEILTFACFKDLDESDREFFDNFIKFCRRSRGFHQY